MLAALAGLRHRRHRPRRRARPRGARVPGGRARRRTGRARSTVVATGDESPMMRRLAPKTAMCIAEHFRDHGENVLLIVDSMTRFAHAARDVALAAGEPPVARGYTPSVFSDLPKLLERAGPGEEGAGSITGVFSVLVDGDDHNDPVADSIRGTLDGHIVLDRAIAEQGRYPAVNVLASVSRLAQPSWTPEQRKLVMKLRDDDRPLRGHPRSAPDGRLSQRHRSRTRPGHPAGAPDLRDHAARPRPSRRAPTSSRRSPAPSRPSPAATRPHRPPSPCSAEIADRRLGSTGGARGQDALS